MIKTKIKTRMRKMLTVGWFPTATSPTTKELIMKMRYKFFCYSDTEILGQAMLEINFFGR